MPGGEGNEALVHHTKQAPRQAWACGNPLKTSGWRSYLVSCTYTISVNPLMFKYIAMPDPPDVPADEVMQTCAANHVRMAARAVTRVFDRALQPVGLKVTQFTILMALARHSFASITDMADQLALKRSSLSRNLSRLEEKGLLVTETAGRSRRARLTRDGRAKAEAAYPLWRQAQARVEERLGADRWREARTLLRSLAHVNTS